MDHDKQLQPVKMEASENDVMSTFGVFQAELRRFVASRLRSRQDSHDVVQEIYVQLVRFNPPNAVRNAQAYVWKVAWHVLNRFNQRRGRDPVRYDSDLVSKVTDRPLEAWVVDADSQEALHERLAQLLKQLPAPVQSAFLLAKRDGVRHKVIAHRMGVSISTINKYVRDAVLFLKNADWDEDTETKERKRR